MADFIRTKWQELKAQTGRLNFDKLLPLKVYAWPAATFLATLLICLMFINNYLQRRAVISHFKNEMHYVIGSLNRAGWDLAYENIDFNLFYPFSLVTFKNLKIYSVSQNHAWEIDELSLNSGFFNTPSLKISLGEKQDLLYAGKRHKVSFDDYHFAVELPADGSVNNMTVQLQNTVISDWADIGEINLAARITAPQLISNLSPSIRGHLDIRKIKLNGLLNYPLGQNIDRIYLNASVLGRIKGGDNLQQALREWLAQDGHIEIKDFNLNWPPLLMVAKGSLYFNETFKPILQLNTSSKALLILIDELETKGWLDSKGAFVVKILLGNKAYKADPEDKHLTVTTPVAVRDDALLVEKIVLKKLFD